MRGATATLVGSVVGGFLASVCCIVPLGLALLGFSGVAWALRFEPWRPHLLVLTYGLLAGAFYLTYRPEPDCEPGSACAPTTARRAGKAALWVAAVVVVLTTAFPLYSAYIF